MMADEQQFYFDVKYPVMEKGKWQHVLQKGESNRDLVEFFSKIYQCFIVQVKIASLEGECIVESSIKTPERIKKYNNLKRFSDECAYAHALEFVLSKELPDTERAIDEILAPIKAPAGIMLN